MATLKAELNNRRSVKDDDSVQALLFAAATAEKSNTTVWHTLVCMYMAGKFEDAKEMASYLESHLPESLIEEAPMTKAGKIKFRSWDTTRNLWKYASIVFKAVEVKGKETVFPMNKEIPTLADVKKMAYGEKKKSSLSQIEKFRVALNNAATAWNGGTVEEQAEMVAILATMPFIKK